MPTEKKEIQVNSTAPVLDTLGSLSRQIGLIVTAIPVLLALLGARNFAGLVDYFRGDDGRMFIGAVTALALSAYGLFQRYRRARQLKDAGQNPANKAITVTK